LSILIVCNQTDPQPWANALRAQLPKSPIEIYPEVRHPEEIRFILCWKPERALFERFPNLEVVQSLGAGVDHILDTQKLLEKTIVARIVDPRLSTDMWEFLLALCMNQIRQLPLYQRQQDRKIWQGHSYKSITETTVSILGLGQIGGDVALRFAQLGFKVQGWSASPKSLLGVRCLDGLNALPNLLGNTDILINLLPLTPQTRGILGHQNLQHLKSSAYLINVGRGGHLVEADLLDLLERGHLAGAALDVLSREPLPTDHPFWEHPKITLTPHIASLTNVETAVGQVVENYQRFVAGRALLNQVSVSKGY